MKILLIYPYFLEARVLTFEDVSAVPLGVYYVAAVLKDRNYDVEVLNWHDLGATPEKIKEVLVEKKPDVIGFSILHGNRWGGIEIVRLAKQIDSRVTIVFGGVGATFLGLGILFQKRGANRESSAILSQGLAHFPRDAGLKICRGVSLMNLELWDQALSHFLEFQDVKEAVRFAGLCYKSLGDERNAAALLNRFEEM